MTANTLHVLQRVWPIILANASVPLLGLADTAVMGRFGTTAELAGLAAVNFIFNLLYWSCGFLRMATTGYVAQASGRGDTEEIQALCLRMFVVALMIGVALVATQLLISHTVFAVLRASEEAESQARIYFHLRIWGAPATLALYVVMGLLIGLGKSRLLLALQVGLNLTNIVLDILLVTVAEWGLAGVAAGTLVTEWLFAGIAIALLVRHRHDPSRPLRAAIGKAFSRGALATAFSANRDLFIRTLCLLLGFGWFLQCSAGFGDTVLAANHLLLAIISFSAFFLDGFAYVAEADVGKAIGTRDRQAFRQSVRTTTICAIVCGILLALGIYLLGDVLLSWLTTIQPVHASATALLPLVCLYIALSAAAFQLDGIFIGALEHRALRNASIASMIFFVACSFALEDQGVTGLWLAFSAYVLARALGLLLAYPAIERHF